jgi:hypothetical protein
MDVGSLVGFAWLTQFAASAFADPGSPKTDVSWDGPYCPNSQLVR